MTLHGKYDLRLYNFCYKPRRDAIFVLKFVS